MLDQKACVGCLLSPLVVALAVFLYIEVEPQHVSAVKNPSWLDDIFSNGVILTVVRLGLIAGIIYVIMSVAGLLSQRRWLSELGPAKASDAAEPVQRLDESAKAFEKQLFDANQTIEDLKTRLAATDDALGRAQTDIGGLLDHVATIEGAK